MTLQRNAQQLTSAPDREGSEPRTAPDRQRTAGRTAQKTSRRHTSALRRRWRREGRCVAFDEDSGRRCRGVALALSLPLCRRHTRRGWLRVAADALSCAEQSRLARGRWRNVRELRGGRS